MLENIAVWVSNQTPVVNVMVSCVLFIGGMMLIVLICAYVFKRMDMAEEPDRRRK